MTRAATPDRSLGSDGADAKDQSAEGVTPDERNAGQESGNTGEGCRGCRKAVPIKGVLVIVGGVLLQLTIGTQLIFGNTSPYVVSYIRNQSSPVDLRHADGTWVPASRTIAMGASMFLGGLLHVKLGPRAAVLITSWFFSAGVLLTYWTVQHSFALTVLTLGVMFGLGCGGAYAVPMGVAMTWFPEHRALVVGIILVGFGQGSTIASQVVTQFVNPDNLPPNVLGENGDVYFDQAEILDRVPTLFLVLGGSYATLQLVATLLMFQPPDSTAQNKKTELDNQRAITLDEIQLPVKDTASKTQEANPSAEVDVDMDVHPVGMLKTPMFYCVWIVFLCGGLAALFFPSLYKAYGLTFIQDDHFLSVVGSCASVVNSVSSVLSGFLVDRYGFKMSIQVVLVILSSAAYTLTASEAAGRGFFLASVCVMFACMAAIFNIVPSAVSRLYGHKYMTVNYGIAYTSQAVAGVLSALVSQQLIGLFGYHGLFQLIGASLTFGLLIAITIQPRDPKGTPI